MTNEVPNLKKKLWTKVATSGFWHKISSIDVHGSRFAVVGLLILVCHSHVRLVGRNILFHSSEEQFSLNVCHPPRMIAAFQQESMHRFLKAELGMV